jgi:hypothetical protein
VGYYDTEGNFRRDDEENAAPGYQDPMYPQPSTTIIPSDELKKNPAQKVDPTAPENPVLHPPTPVAPAAAQASSTPTDTAAADPFALAPPQQRKTVETTDSSYSRTRSVVGKEEKAQLDKLDKLSEEEQAAAKKLGGIEGEKAKETLAAKQQAADLAEQKKAQVESAVQWGNEQLNSRMADYEEQYKKLQKMDVRDYFAGPEGNTRKLTAALAIIFGGAGAAAQAKGGETGVTNKGFEALNQTIQRERQTQLDKIAKQRDDVAHAKAGIDLAHQSKVDAINDVNLRTAAAYDSIANQYEAKLAQFGMDEAAAKTDATVVALRQKAAQFREQIYSQTRDHVTSQTQKRVQEIEGTGFGAGGGGKITDSQRKADAHLQRMLPEAEALKKNVLSEQGRRLLENEFRLEYMRQHHADATAIAQLAGLNKTLQQKLSANDRLAYTAAQAWLTPLLRTDSGAVIHPDEQRNYFQQFIPTLGDGSQDLAAKDARRDNLMRSLAMQGSDPRRAAQFGARAGGAAPAPSAPAFNVVQKRNKNTGEVRSFKQFADGHLEPM